MKKLLLLLVCTLALGAKTVDAQAVSLSDAIRNASVELSAGVGPNTRVAVVSMRADSVRMSNHLIDEMIMAFVATQRLLVVNRAQLDIIAAELHLGLDGWIDDATAQSIGRLAGVQTIFTGAFEPFGNIYRLRIQAIEVETAIIRNIHTVDVRNDDSVSALLGAAGRTPPRRDPDQPRVNWLSAEASSTSGLLNYRGLGFGFGLRYERDVNEFFSMGVVFLFNFDWDFGALGTARLFLFGSPFYLEAGIGAGFGHRRIRVYSPDHGHIGTHEVPSRGLMLSLGAGARFGGRTGGFFANPFFSVFPVVPTEGIRFRGGIGMGWAW